MSVDRKNTNKGIAAKCLNVFFPDEYVDSTYVIDFDNLYAQGYRGLLFDIDNTLVPHGAPADERACALFAHLKELGFKCCFLSNNQYERVSSFNDAIGEYFIEDAHKPSTKNYIRAMELLGTDRSNTILWETSCLLIYLERNVQESVIFW